jgi:gluconokinase
VSWVSLHEFFLLKLFGRSLVSHSLASWTGLLNHARLDWDDEVLSLSGIRREQLSPLAGTKDFLSGLNQEYRERWPALARVPFFAAWGDGATANVGSGCIDETLVAATIGTSGALRVVLAQPNSIPQGLWLYRVDAHRSLLGGSLNNGGNVFAYLNRTLQLPDVVDLESKLAALQPDAHGLTVLPFFAGERSPGYQSQARAAVIGLSLDTPPVEIVRAALEAVAYRLALIYTRLREAIPRPREIIASGAALLSSPAWAQILADVLGEPITLSEEQEVSARGAAVLALEALGAVESVSELAPTLGNTIAPNPAHHEIYRRAVERQSRLYDLLIGARAEV